MLLSNKDDYCLIPISKISHISFYSGSYFESIFLLSFILISVIVRDSRIDYTQLELKFN